MPTVVRKTNNYYRNKIAESSHSAFSVIEEVVKKYGVKKYIPNKRTYDCIVLHTDHDMGWNFRISQFEYRKGKLYMWIYWQGDSTDGDEVVEFDSNGFDLPIIAERSYIKRPYIKVRSRDIYDAIKSIKL